MKKLSISPAFTPIVSNFVLFQPIRSHIDTPLGFKTITFTKDSLLSPYNCLRVNRNKAEVSSLSPNSGVVSSTLNHGKALTVYPYVFPIGSTASKALQFRYLKQLHLPLNSLLIHYKIFLFRFQPFNVDKFIGNWHHINIADCL
jgi:hypothetical protein